MRQLTYSSIGTAHQLQGCVSLSAGRFLMSFFSAFWRTRRCVDCRSVVNATQVVLLRGEWLERYGSPAKKLCGKLVLLLAENLDMKERLFNENIFTYLYGL